MCKYLTTLVCCYFLIILLTVFDMLACLNVIERNQRIPIVERLRMKRRLRERVFCLTICPPRMQAADLILQLVSICIMLGINQNKLSRKDSQDQVKRSQCVLEFVVFKSFAFHLIDFAKQLTKTNFQIGEARFVNFLNFLALIF